MHYILCVLPDDVVFMYCVFSSDTPSPRRAHNQLADQELPHLLWNLKVYYSLQCSPPLYPTLSQLSKCVMYLDIFLHLVL